MMIMGYHWHRVLLLSATAAAFCNAQATISGRVLSRADSAPIARAQLGTYGESAKTTVDASGRFRIARARVRGDSLQIVAIGFQPLSVALRQANASGDLGDLFMSPVGQRMGSVVVNGTRVSVPPSLEEPYARMARGVGAFFTKELIDSLNPSDLRSLLARVPTVSVNDRGIQFQKCSSGLQGLRPADALTPVTARPFALEGQTNLRRGAPVAVYVDGVRPTRRDIQDPDDAGRVLRSISAASVQLMEVYSGQSRIPGEYGTDACAVILVWTRRY